MLNQTDLLIYQQASLSDVVIWLFLFIGPIKMTSFSSILDDTFRTSLVPTQHRTVLHFSTLAAACGWNKLSLLTTYWQGLEPSLRLHLSSYSTTGPGPCDLIVMLHQLSQRCINVCKAWCKLWEFAIPRIVSSLAQVLGGDIPLIASTLQRSGLSPFLEMQWLK